MVSIIDYEAGNIKSVENAVRFLGQDSVLTRDPKVILSSDHCILPGVGAFGDAMARLREFGLDEVIRETVRKGIPFLGICLGLQLLFESSEESPGTFLSRARESSLRGSAKGPMSILSTPTT